MLVDVCRSFSWEIASKQGFPAVFSSAPGVFSILVGRICWILDIRADHGVIYLRVEKGSALPNRPLRTPFPWRFSRFSARVEAVFT